MSRSRSRTVSFSYSNTQIERQIDSFLDTFKKRSAAAMERAQSLQGGSSGLLSTSSVSCSDVPLKSSPKIKFHIPRRKVRWTWGGNSIPRSKSGVSVASTSSISSGASYEGNLHRSMPHSLAEVEDDSDEALEESGCALSVRDVSELLHSQYAIISGGKSTNGCPIITFPDRGNFSQLTDEEYRKLIIYITSVPSLQDADLGFILIIDRRNDKWNALKTVLLKVSGFFPGLITVAYVLRPVRFLQKAISEVSSKIFRDEFKFRVVVCDDVGELHDYIDRNQLTDDLNGCIAYNHVEWIEQRVAVEKFSANTQEISGALRAFTQLLQETEFPNDVDSCEDLLKEQTSHYGGLKSDLLIASKHGDALLACIKQSGEASRAFQLFPDKLINVTAVERLLVQLEETEKTFDVFWSNHSNRITDCLQLRRFEYDFKELQPVFEESLKSLAEMTHSGNSVETVDKLISETQEFHEGCVEQLVKAEELSQRGLYLIEIKHYGLDSIQPKHIELDRMRETFQYLITARLNTLHKSRELYNLIGKANEWCTTGVELLASHHFDQFQSKKCADSALRELNDFLSSSAYFSSAAASKATFSEDILPESEALIQQVLKRIDDVHLMCQKRKASLKKLTSGLPKPVRRVNPEPMIASVSPELQPTSSQSSLSSHLDFSESQRSLKFLDEGDSSECTYDAETATARKRHILKELLETEKTYVSELCSVLKGYKDEMMSQEMQTFIPINLYGKSDILFGNMGELFRFHNDVFLRDLESCLSNPELIGICFIQRRETFHHLYSKYCQNKPLSEELRLKVGDDNIFFKECQRRLGHKLPLGAYLLKPVQRITKYQLLLKDLLKYVDTSEGKLELQEAVDTMLSVLKCLNDLMHQVAISNFPGSLAELGNLLMQGPFCVWSGNKKTLREIRLKPAQRHLFLYDKMLLFTKRVNKDTEKESYSFKNALRMSDIGLTESVRGSKGDIRKFEVWLQGRQEVYTILAPSPEAKEDWVREIKRVLLNQFEYLKGENIRQYSMHFIKGAPGLNGYSIPAMSPQSHHRTLKGASSWDTIAGSSVSLASSSSKASREKQGKKRRSEGGSSRSTEGNRTDTTEDEPEEEEENWFSDYSPSEEEDSETFSESQEQTPRFLVLADYNATGPSEINIRDGDYVDLLKVGCAGWWYVRLCGTSYEGWAPAAYLERILKKDGKGTPSISSQDSSSNSRDATSRSSAASFSNRSDDHT